MLRSRILMITCLTILTHWPLLAHPSWGIVVGTDGMVYFVDVMHNSDGTLWKFDPGTENLEAVRTGFHAHNLISDLNGDLYSAVAIWRTGSIEGEGLNYLFRYCPEEDRLDTLVLTDDWDDFYGGNFALSRDGIQVYFPMDGKLHVKNLITNETSTLPLNFSRFCTMTVDVDDALWISDSQHKDGTIFRWTERLGLEEFTTNFFPEDRENAIFENRDHHLFYGIGFSKSGKPLISENVENSIWELSEDGTKRLCYSSSQDWHPSGVYYRDRSYYVLEHGFKNRNLGPRLVLLDESFRVQKTFEFEF